MKSLILAFFLFAAGAIASAAEMTNGVFYVDNAVSCHLVSQNGSVTTNDLSAGRTYMVGNTLLEMETTNKTAFYFSGGPLIEVSPNAKLSVNLFDQEVNNLSSTPRKPEYGSHNLSLKFDVGEYSVIYPSKDANSSLTITTPYTSYELQGGKYYFRVSDKSAIVYVLEGMMNVHGDKRVDKTEKGRLAVAIPFTDPASGVEDKIVTSIKALKQEETERFATPILLAEKKWADVQFFVINGRVIGAWVK